MVGWVGGLVGSPLSPDASCHSQPGDGVIPVLKLASNLSPAPPKLVLHPKLQIYHYFHSYDMVKNVAQLHLGRNTLINVHIVADRSVSFETNV